MSVVITPPCIHSTPPASIVPINTGNPISRGLCVVSFPVGGNVVNVTQGGVSELFATKSGSSAITRGSSRALAASFSTTTTDSWRLISTANRTDTVFERPSSAVTLLVFAMRRGNNVNGTAPLFVRGSAVTSPYNAYGILDLNGTGVFRGSVAAGGVSYSVSVGTIPNMKPVTLAVRYDGTKVDTFLGGNLCGTTSASGSITYPNATDSAPTIGNYYNFTSSARSFNGDIYLSAVWDRALTDAELYSLSVNPYQILLSNTLPIYADIVSGLTSVSSDKSLIYNLLHYVQQDKSIEWNTLNSINKDDNISWHINTSVTSDKTFSWDALNQVIADKVIEWNLEQYVQSDKGMSWDILNNVVSDGILSWNTTSRVTTDINTTWNIISSVFVDKTINYDILISATKDESISWDISQFVFADKGLTWDIESTMLTAFADIPIRYDIVNSVYSDFNSYWDLLQTTFSDKSFPFDILNNVMQDQSIAWGISEVVVNDLIITSNLLSLASGDIVLAWNSAGVVGNNLVINYTIQSNSTSNTPSLSRTITISLADRSINIQNALRTINLRK